jgi:lipid A 4'-phosphatase
MNYIKQKHTQILFLCFFISSIIFIAFSSIDIQISNMFYDNGFYLKGSWWERLLYKSVKPFLTISIITVIGLWLVNKYMNKKIFAIDGKKTLFLILVLVLGSGLIVNAIFKDNFGRARPRDIVEFNGTKEFQPAFVISQECDRNCSFSSGHGSGAFFFIALALFFKRRKSALLIAFVYGSLVSLARISAGGHFFSDNVVSFFIMAITTDVLFYYLFLYQKQD